MIMQTEKSKVRHPARYTMSLLPIFAGMLVGSTRILDPFAGTGRIFLLEQWLPECQIEGVEIEPEWAALDPRSTLGNALALPWGDHTFDAICTSPVYGSRMSDHHNARDTSRRNTYRHALGRPLHRDNSGSLQWGEAYRSFHQRAWAEARRVLQPGGKFVLNIKDHIRGGKRQHVTDWHVATLIGLGFDLIRHEQIQTPGQRFGQNGKARIDYESVILFGLY